MSIMTCAENDSPSWGPGLSAHSQQSTEVHFLTPVFLKLIGLVSKCIKSAVLFFADSNVVRLEYACDGHFFLTNITKIRY